MFLGSASAELILEGGTTAASCGARGGAARPWGRVGMRVTAGPVGIWSGPAVREAAVTVGRAGMGRGVGVRGDHRALGAHGRERTLLRFRIGLRRPLPGPVPGSVPSYLFRGPGVAWPRGQRPAGSPIFLPRW